MFSVTYLSIIFSSFIIISCSKTFSINYEELLGKFHCYIGLDKCNQAYIEFDLSIDFFWISSYSCSVDKLKLLFNNETTNIIVPPNYETSTNILYGSLILNSSSSIKNIRMYYVPQRIAGYFDSIGLAFDNTNQEHSFLFKLKENNHISHLGFGFFHSIKGVTSRGDVLFGEIPEQYTINKNKFSFKIDLDKKKWGSYIQKIIIGNLENNYEQKEYYGVFNTNQRYISVPEKVFQWLENIVFIDFINKDICKVEKYFISCKAGKLSDFPDMSILLHDHIFKLSPNELFIYTGASYYFIMNKEKNLKENEWILGTPLLKKYESYFDVENKEISFFSSDNFNKKSNQNFYAIRILLILIIIIVSLCTLNFITLKNKMSDAVQIYK